MTLSNIDLSCGMVFPSEYYTRRQATSIPRKSPVPPTERSSLVLCMIPYPSIDTVARTMQLFSVQCPHLTLSRPAVPPYLHPALSLVAPCLHSTLSLLCHHVGIKLPPAFLLRNGSSQNFPYYSTTDQASGTVIRTFIGTVIRTAPKTNTALTIEYTAGITQGRQPSHRAHNSFRGTVRQLCIQLHQCLPRRHPASLRPAGRYLSAKFCSTADEAVERDVIQHLSLPQDAG